jgi:hypothetical protein
MFDALFGRDRRVLSLVTQISREFGFHFLVECDGSSAGKPFAAFIARGRGRRVNK